MFLILLGPPGSGKGSLAQHLQTTRAVRVFEMGAALRRYADAHDPALATALAAGEMAPTELANQLLDSTLAETGGHHDLLLDGYPRTIPQAEMLQTLIERHALPRPTVVVLDAPPDLLLGRVIGRETCTQCGRVFHRTFAPSPAQGYCLPACGGTLGKRPEDSAEGLARRLATFHQLTLPAIAALEETGMPILRLDASPRPALVHGQLDRALSSMSEPTPGPSSLKVPNRTGRLVR